MSAAAGQHVPVQAVTDRATFCSTGSHGIPAQRMQLRAQWFEAGGMNVWQRLINPFPPPYFQPNCSWLGAY